jgi:hypothetical protein
MPDLMNIFEMGREPVPVLEGTAAGWEGAEVLGRDPTFDPQVSREARDHGVLPATVLGTVEPRPEAQIYN